MPMGATVAGIILAGGQSKRMGRDKSLLPLPGAAHTTFIAHLATLLSKQCREVIVVARDAVQAANFTILSATPSMRVVIDQQPGVGPLMGIYSGLSALCTTTTHALVIAVDTPFIQPALLAFLLTQVPDDDTTLLVPLVEGAPQVLHAIYPRTLLPIIAERLHAGKCGPRTLLDMVPVRYIDEALLRQHDPQLQSFINLNTPEEFAAYQE